MNTLAHVTEAVKAAVEQRYPDAPTPQVTRTQDLQFGDYQTNAAMHLAKGLKRNPRELAGELAGVIPYQGFAEAPEIAGPGFINFRLSQAFLASQVLEAARDARGGVGQVAKPETVVVEYSSPNVAKRLHVGHLRSTILGDAMRRILDFLGHKTISDNHLGDWGTQFGLLIVAYRRWADPAALEADPIGHLESLYQKASALAKEDPAFAAEGRAELAKLHKGDAENLAIWEKFVSISRGDVQKLYDMLGVHFDHWMGESFYNPMLDDLAKELEAKGIAREDEGALVVFFDGDADLEKHPFLVRKQDGAFLYSTTDIATVRWRELNWRPDRVLYFVDKRQALHFSQLFAVVRKLGYTGKLEHIDFGSILNAEGRPLKTREGNTPSLRNLLQEGIDAAKALMVESRPDFSPEKLEETARAVGVGAIKYADLSQNRTTDYKFDLAKMIAFDGNTGPYLQYTHARICSVFRKLEGEWTAPEAIALAHPDEIALARQLVRFEETLVKAAEACMPNYVAEYLFSLARAYSAFYTNCPILKAEGVERETRLALCRAVQNHLRIGLTCLGIEPLSEM